MHRDIKPDNFVASYEPSPRTVYIIDYGLAKPYKDPKTHSHIAFREGKKLTGTARYASIYTHQGYEQGRRDDLECLGYVLVYLAKGQLPWQGLKAPSKEKRYESVMNKKKSTTVELLCKGLPIEFAQYIHYSRAIKFEDKPDYMRLRKLFVDLFHKQRYNHDFDFDWNHLGLDVRRVHSSVKVVEEEAAQNQPKQPPLAKPSDNSSPYLLPPSPERSPPGEDSPKRRITTQSLGIPAFRSTAPNEESKHEKEDAAGIKAMMTIMPRSQNTFTLDKRKKGRKSAEDSCNFEPEDIVEDVGLFGTALQLCRDR